MRCWIVTWLAVAGTSLLAEDTRKPAPVPLEQESAEEAIRELYAKQFGSKDLETRRALAKKLLSEADLERDDVARFVLLKNARDLGREVGDFGVAFRAIEEMARDYRLEELTLKREVLEGASTSKLDLIAKERRTDSWLALIDSAVEKEDFTNAKDLAEAAVTKTKKLRDSVLTKRVEAKRSSVVSLSSKHAKVTPHLVTLRSDPEDPAANEAVGEFYSFAIGSFARGLPLLVKGSASDLQEAAQ